MVAGEIRIRLEDVPPGGGAEGRTASALFVGDGGGMCTFQARCPPCGAPFMTAATRRASTASSCGVPPNARDFLAFLRLFGGERLPYPAGPDRGAGLTGLL